MHQIWCLEPPARSISCRSCWWLKTSWCARAPPARAPPALVYIKHRGPVVMCSATVLLSKSHARGAQWSVVSAEKCGHLIFVWQSLSKEMTKFAPRSRGTHSEKTGTGTCWPYEFFYLFGIFWKRHGPKRIKWWHFSTKATLTIDMLYSKFSTKDDTSNPHSQGRDSVKTHIWMRWHVTTHRNTNSVLLSRTCTNPLLLSRTRTNPLLLAQTLYWPRQLVYVKTHICTHWHVT